MGTEDSHRSPALSFAPEDVFITLGTGVKMFLKAGMMNIAGIIFYLLNKYNGNNL